MKKLFDEIRKCWVIANPEEIVRQLWIKKMVYELGYPKELIAIEKELKTLPHLEGKNIPDRRADIICFANKDHLSPLLLVECKAGPLTPKAIEQALGYNLYVQAPYIALVNEEEIYLSSQYNKLKHLLPYPELVAYA